MRVSRFGIEVHLPEFNVGGFLPSRTIGGWIAALRRFRPATPLLELEDGYSACPTVYRFARDARDGRHRLVSVVTRFPRDEPLEEYAELLLAALQTLDPDDVAELDVSFALAKADKATRVAIEAAAARFPRVTHVSVT